MRDLISRQEAINKLVMLGKVPGHSKGERNIIACTIAMLDSLPSAQPKVVRCKDCVLHGVCAYERGLGKDGFCSQGKRREDG